MPNHWQGLQAKYGRFRGRKSADFLYYKNLLTKINKKQGIKTGVNP